jgi:hypothetical protein
MVNKGFTSKLKLAYPPISNYDFSIVRDEPAVQEMLREGMLYIICQRPILTFENISTSEDGQVFFEIHQQQNMEKLDCSFTVRQAAICSDPEKPVDMELGSNNPGWQYTTLPANEVDAFKFYSDSEFLGWLTPERFIYEYVNKNLIAVVKGNVREFVRYKVHYVGKATEQPIWTRLTGHNTLQDILSKERPMAAALPTHEITLLLLEISDAWSFKIYSPDDTFGEGPVLPTKKEIALDAEKLLIKMLDPHYNDPKKRFASYPKSSDGLFKHQFERFAYQITDELVLAYDKIAVNGSVDENKADILAIENNEKVTVVALHDWDK